MAVKDKARERGENLELGVMKMGMISIVAG